MGDPDYSLAPEDLAAHERAHGRVPPGACVALRSGRDAYVATPRFRNAGASGAPRFPGFRRRGAAAARARRRRRGGGHAVAGPRQLARLRIPSGLARRRPLGAQCAANLGALPPTGATIVVGAPRIAGGTGGPGRALALL